jgi:hypothetical protein
MADDADESVEGALKCLVIITDRSGNLRKDIKKGILEAVSSLRHYFAHVQENLDFKKEANKKQKMEVKECKAELQRLRTWESSRAGQVAPSMDTIRRDTNIAHQVQVPGGRTRELYRSGASMRQK